jgi:hypothetical protein
MKQTYPSKWQLPQKIFNKSPLLLKPNYTILIITASLCHITSSFKNISLHCPDRFHRSTPHIYHNQQASKMKETEGNRLFTPI